MDVGNLISGSSAFSKSNLNRSKCFSGTLLLFFLDDPVDVGNLASSSSAFSKSNLNIWKFTVHILLKPGLENCEHYFASVWNECNWTHFEFEQIPVDGEG